MKKITAFFIAMFLIGISVHAQTQSKQNKAKTVKLSTKNKVILAVNSQKTKAAINKVKVESRKEGE